MSVKVTQTKPSLTTIYNRLYEIRERIATLSDRLNNAHEATPRNDLDAKSVENSTPDFSISAINDKVSSIEYFLRNCEDTVNRIVG